MKGLTELKATLQGLREPAALATLVRTKGSSYRKPGARMVWGPDGPQTGGISAGCLETDVKERVVDILASRQPGLLAFDLGSDLDLVWGTRMGCQGKADVLLERVEPGVPAWLEICGRMLDERRSGAMATVFAVRGPAPAAPGDRFILEGDRELLPMPAPLSAPLRQAMAGKASEACTIQAGDSELDVLVEPIQPPIALWVFGAGEHARPLFRLAGELGWFLGLVDHRPALATAERFPQADRIILGHPPESLDGLPFDGRTGALVVSHVYDADKAALARLLTCPLGYLGLQGNRRRSERILRELEEEEGPLSVAARALLHYPAGLDLGAETPELIALSMLAEVQAVLAARTGGSLRDREGAIHGQ